MKLEFSRQIFEKSSNIKFHENPSKPSCSSRRDGRTGHEVNSCSSLSCERA